MRVLTLMVTRQQKFIARSHADGDKATEINARSHADGDKATEIHCASSR
jgi:hypothetical protein